MKKRLICLLMAIVTAAMLSVTAFAVQVDDYTDLDASLWYYNGVKYCVEKEFLSGVSENAFAPNEPISRAAFVTALWKAEGMPVVNYLMQFDDVTQEEWYSEAVRWAASEKIMVGYSKTLFGINDPITREEAAAVLYRYEQKQGGGFQGMWMYRLDYADLENVSEWAFEAICWLNMKGVISGKPDKILDPKGSATRAQAAVMLQKYCEIMSTKE